MKDILKYSGLIVIGLFVAVVLYPFLHESGHSLAALLVGARVVDFELWPLPAVLCEVSTVDRVGFVGIGLGGMLLPMFVSLLYRPRFFWMWYGIWVTKGICVLSFVISIVAILLNAFGIVIPNEDVLRIVEVWSGGVLPLVLLLSVATLIMLRSMIRQKPLSRIFRYFEVPIQGRIREKKSKLPGKN